MEYQDKTLKCIDCGTDFVFTAGEQLFFHDKQFKNEPKRCKNCKGKRVAVLGATATEPCVEEALGLPNRKHADKLFQKPLNSCKPMSLHKLTRIKMSTGSGKEQEWSLQSCRLPKVPQPPGHQLITSYRSLQLHPG